MKCFFTTSQHRKTRGFTLIEMLLALAITTSLLLVMVGFTHDILEGQVKQRTIREVSEQGDLIMDKILTLIHNADSITTPATGSSSNLELSFSNPAQDPTIISINSGIIELQQDGGSATPLHNSRVTTTNLTFTDRTKLDTWGTVDIEFTISYASPSTRNPYTYERTWYGTAVIREYVR